MSSYVEIDGWEANIRFSSAHIIPEYEKCGRLHGHTYAIHAKIYGKPDKNGIIVDFSFLKKVLRGIADDLDHKILIPKNHPSVKIGTKDIEINNMGKRYIFPIEDCKLLPISSTSAENLSGYVLNLLANELSGMSNIHEIEVGVDEGFGQGARLNRVLGSL